jgi:hypothetical protein
MAANTLRAIPDHVKDDVLWLAILEVRLRQTRKVARTIRQRIEAKRPGASRLVRNRQFLQAAIQEHNERATSVKAVRP